MRQSLLITTQKQFQQTSSISDKLYFEPLTIEDVMHIIDLEQARRCYRPIRWTNGN